VVVCSTEGEGRFTDSWRSRNALAYEHALTATSRRNRGTPVNTTRSSAFGGLKTGEFCQFGGSISAEILYTMPRPKRLKVAPSAPVQRARPNSTIVVEVPRISREARAEYIDMTNVSDAEVEVVAPVMKRGRGRPRKRALPVEDHPNEHEDNTSGSEHAAPEAPVVESLLGDIDLESSSPSLELGRRDRNSTTFESSSLSIANFRRRPRQPSILGRGSAQARSSSVESNRADGNNLASMSSRNVSTLSIGNFKRRPRQPSILGRARSSSIGFDTDRGTPAQPASALKLGAFKRRARESSVLGTGRKPQQDRAVHDDEDEDDFNPEDESTPLNKAKTAPATISLPSSSNPRKCKLSSAHISQPSPAVPTPGSIELQDSPAVPPLIEEPADEYDIPSSPPEAPMPSIEALNSDPINETMAPPQSSSSPPESPLDSTPPSLVQRFQSQEHQSRGRRPFRGRTPTLASQDSPISSPPPLTHSPNPPARGTDRVTPATKTRGRRPAAPPSTFSTAQLQSLLPRRRRPINRDPYEISSSDDEVDISGTASDDDELTNLSVAPQSRRTANSFIRRPAPLRRPGRPRNQSKTRPDTARGKATYGSRLNATSDKENEEYDPDHSLAPLPDHGDEETSQEKSRDVGQEKELKEAAMKFKEVDKWELEFEDVTASSSSPLGAR
jgi:hypothetical protein